MSRMPAGRTGWSRSKRTRAGRRTAAAAAVAVLGVAGVACTPPPESEMFDGGTYPIEIDVAPQTVTNEFDLLGLAQCSTTATTPEVDIDGSLTLAPAELSPDATKVTIPSASLELPASRISAGSVSLTCDGEHVGTLGLVLEFSAAASVQTAVLDTEARTVTLTDPTITVTDARVSFAGAPEGTPPVELDPIDVTVPTISVPL